MLRFVLIIIAALVLAKIIGWLISFWRALTRVAEVRSKAERGVADPHSDQSTHPNAAESDIVDARFIDLPPEKNRTETD